MVNIAVKLYKKRRSEKIEYINMMNAILLNVLSSAVIMGEMVFGNEQVLFRKTTTLPGLLNTSTSVCRLWNDVVSSRIDCANSCAIDDQCILFMYDKSGNCSTYCDIETDLGGTLGTVYMVVREAVYGDHCTDSEQCILPHSICYAGTCTCQLGYSYRPTNLSCIQDMNVGVPCKVGDVCVTPRSICNGMYNICTCDYGYSYNPGNMSCQIGCDVYSANFTGFNGSAISYHNLVNYTSVSFDWCANECVSTWTSSCVSIEYTPTGMCNIQTVGWLDVEYYYRLLNLDGYAFYQRDCDI